MSNSNSGKGADECANDDGHDRGRQANSERYTTAVEHAGEQILAEVVGAEGMAPGRTVEMGAEIDVVDRLLPQQRPKANREQHNGEKHGAGDRQTVSAKPPPGAAAARGLARERSEPCWGVSDRRCEGRASHTGRRRSD